MARNYSSGTYRPKNPKKYAGNKYPKWRSSWEHQFMRFCDDNTNIIEWASEGIKIPYIDPFTGKRRNYIPDFLIRYKDKTGKEFTELIEIKPLSQTSLKEAGRSKHNREAAQLNEAKWKSAIELCKEMKITFRILTEKELFHTGKRK